ncbi:MAG: glycoside hydrolase family 127 protein [Acidobacteria bacterium]|nr:glycoside hydrolase family 127 protein [Acidobacteriota bacterium]
MSTRTRPASIIASAVAVCLLAPALALPAVVPEAARPLPLSAVRLTGGPFKHAQDLDAAYLLSLETDRLLAPFRAQAGLAPGAEGYGGWDGGGRNLTGHILGHYLSAVSMMWAATGDTRFKQRADTIVAGLALVQTANRDGYLGALEGGRARFAEIARGDIRSTGFDLNGLWSPWYTLHKVYAGLRDAYRFTGNRTALDLEIAFAAWAEGVVGTLTDEQLQKMLNTEFGGMNEVLVDLAADTGEARWLALSRRFEHRAVLDPLKRHEDRLGGLHGNTQVPKLLGSLARFALTGDAGDGFAAGFFFDRVAGHHSYATGGHGKDEYFGDPDRLSDRVDGRTAESCNVYNMLKLARRLFALRAEAYIAEFHERALFNHVLASIDPEDGRTCYMVPVGRGVQREYQDMAKDFTCCVGSGMESHALHGDGIYFASDDRLWVNLYVPSTAEWRAAGVRLAVATDVPEGESASIRLAVEAPRAFTLALRRPGWAEAGFAVRINGEAVTTLPPPGSYLELARTWRTGDTVAVGLPKTLRLVPVPDNPRRAAILWGPLVLAGDLGPENDFPAWQLGAVPALVAAERPVADWLKPVEGRPGVFRTAGVGRDTDVELRPFHRLHRRTYAVYWDHFTPQEWARQAAAIAADRERQRRLALATVAFVQPGEMQPERDFNFQGEDTQPDRAAGRACRRGSKWFSFDLPVEASRPMALVVNYYHDEWRTRTFDILVNGEKVGEQVVERGGVPHAFDVTYQIPAALVRGKQAVTVRFQATGGNEIAGVYGLRMIRADAER